MNVSSWLRSWLKVRRADLAVPVALGHAARLSLRKLEDRQVLSVSASFLGGVLDVAIDGGTDSNPQHVDNTNNVLITVDALNQVLINGVLVDSDNGFVGVQSLDAMHVSSINVHDVAGAANTIDLSGVSFGSGFTHAGGVSVSLVGGAGADTITGSGFNDLVAGGAGNDSLRGGGGNDVYQFQDSFGVDTVIDTGGTVDSLDFSAVTSDVTVNLQTPKATVGTNSVSFAVAEIDSIVGHSGGNDTLQGLNAASNWNIGSAGTDYSSPGAAINASGFETFQGGSLADTFHVGSAGSWALKGGAGADVFDIDAPFSGTLDGQADSDTLQGTGGSIAGPVTISTGDRLSPGDSPGILSTGNLVFANSSTFVVEIDDDSNAVYPGGGAGIDYDQMQVAGTLTIGTTVTLDLQDIGSTFANARDVYTIISNDGTADAVSGTFNGLANGAVVTATGGITYRIFYNGGDGNDVVLIGRPSTLPDVFVSTSFVGLIPGALITDVDFITAGDQAGIYGLDGYATITEAIAGVDSGGIIHVNSGTYVHTGTLAVNKSVTIDGQGMNLTQILKSGAPTGNFDEAIRISANDVTFSDVKLGWQTHTTTDYQGYVVYTSVDNTTISRVLFGSNATGEGYRSAVVFEGVGANGADGLEVSNSVFEGRWGRAAIRDGDNGSGQNFLITHNEFREDHFRWGPIAIGPQDSAGTPNNFAFSGEISFNYFGNGLDTLDFQSLGNQNYTVTITNQGLTAAGLDIVHNTFDWNDSNETNVEGVFAQPAGVYITPSFTANTNQILIQDNIFNNFAYTGPQPGTTDPLWRPTGGVFGGALEFDGADDFGVWQSSLFNVGTTGTLNFWVQLQDTATRSQFFEGPGNAGFEMQYRPDSGGQVYGRTTTVGGDFVIRRGTAEGGLQGDGALLTSVGANNSWHNIQYTWDFSTKVMQIYVDGVASTYLAANNQNLTWAAVVSTVNEVMSIGRDPGTSGRYFDGIMDDVGWFNSVLTTTELTQIRDTTGTGVAELGSDARLVAHWDFDETSGNIATDNRNGIEIHLSTNGIAALGPNYLASGGRFGGALDFDGLDDLATFQDPDFNVGARGTLNFWVNLDNTSVPNQFFEGPGNAGFEFQYRTNSPGGQVFGRATTVGGDFVIRSGGDAALLSSAGAFSGWHNIQYTWDISAGDATTGEMRIYVDGIETGYLAASTQTLTWASVVDTANGLMHMGYDPGSDGQFLDGQIDDVAWYNDVLTTTELATVRTSGAAAHTDLVAHWKFDSAPTVDNTYLGDSGTDIVLYLQQLPPAPPVSGYGVVTPAAAVVLNNVFYNEVGGDYADSNQVLDPSNITGPTANPFFNGDQIGYSGTTLEDFYTLRFGSSAAYQSTEFEANIATAIPHIGANQENPLAIGTEDILVVGSDFDDLVVVTFTSDNDGFFTYTRNVTGVTPDYVGTFNFTNITSFTFDAYGGDDVFIVYQPTAAQGSLYSLVNGITFHGGLENNNGNALDSDGTTGGDTLVLLKSATDQAVLDSATYVFGNETAEGHAGTISLSDAALSTVITFTGTEPIRDELSVNERTFTFASTVGGGNETITVSTPGDTVAMRPVAPYKPAVTSRTLDNLITSTLGPSVSFNNPHTLLDLNAGVGNDIVNVNSIHAAYRAELDISGDGDFDTVNLNADLTLGDATVGNTGDLTVTSETINVSADVATSGTGDISLIASRNVSLTGGSSLTTVDGGITLIANSAGTSGGDFVGIRLDNATITTQGTGNISLEGRGGDTGSDQYGIHLLNGAQVESTSSGANAGTITLDGTGGATIGNSNYGVFLKDSLITSVSGAILITGHGGGVGGSGGNFGIRVSANAQVTSTGTGPSAATITLDGTGGVTTGDGNSGVFLDSSLITSVSGDISITGWGGSPYGDGIHLKYAQVASTGTGPNAATITLDGTAGSSGFGIDMTDVTTLVTSVDGAITLNGQGGGVGSSTDNIGIRIELGARVTSTGTGLMAAAITLDGTGGATTGNGLHGVYLTGANTLVTSVDGAISITGQGGGSGSSSANYGIRLATSAAVTSTGIGSIALNGIGGGVGGSTTNDGVRIETGSTISSTDASGATTGDITITGTAGAGTSSLGINFLSGSVTTVGAMGGTAHVTLIADSINIDSTNASISVGTKTVTLWQKTAGGTVSIDLGGADASGVLGLTNDELDRITAGELHIGNSNSGAITVSSDINLSTASTVGGGTVPVLCLTSGSTVTGTAGGVVVADLSILAADTVNFTDLTTNVSNLAIETSSGSVAFTEADGFTVTTVCGEVGVSTVDANIALVSGGDITLLDDVNAGTERVTLDVGGAIIDGDVVDSPTTADILAGEVDLRARTGIANGSKLEVATAKLAATTATGDINVRDVSGDLTIATLLGGTAGLSITAGTAGDDVCVTTVGALTVDAEVSSTGTGVRAILLAADGTAASNDLTVNAHITTTGGNSPITLIAGDTVSFAGTTITHAAGTGAVQVRAGQAFNNGSGDTDGSAGGNITMDDGSIIRSDDGHITLTAPKNIQLSIVNANADADATLGDITLTADFAGPVSAGAGNLYASNGVGAITEVLSGEGANLIGGTATLTAATGIGSAGGNADINTTVAVLNVTNATSGNIDLHEADAVTVVHLSQSGGGNASLRTVNGTITVDNAGVVPNAITFTGGGTLLLDANGVAADVIVNDGIQAVLGHVTLQADRDIVATSAPIASSGGNGSIVMQAVRDVRILDPGNLNPVDVAVAGTGDIRLSAATGVVVLGSQNPTTTPDAIQHTVPNDVILQTGTGAVTNTLPLVFNIQAPQVNAQGEVFLNMDIGRPGEKNITVTVFWGDGTFTKTTFADPGNYTFEHQYFGNPNALDPSAPILVNVQVAHDPHVVLTAHNVNTPAGSVPNTGVFPSPPVPAQNINADLGAAIFVSDTRPAEAGPFSGAATKVFSAPGDVDNPGLVVFQDTTVKATTIPVPGTGLASFPFDVTPPVALLAIPEATRFLDILQVSGVQLSDSNSSRTELARSDDSQLAERLVTLEVLSPDDTVRQRVVLPETVLEDMLEVIGRLPDGKYRFQLQEPGEERQRLLLEFEVRQGKIADDTEESDRPPSATKKKTGAPAGGSEVIPDGSKADEAPNPDSSIMWANPPEGIPGEGPHGELLTTPVPASRADRETPANWSSWSSIATRRAWNRAKTLDASPYEPSEWSSEDTPLETTAPTSNDRDHTLAGGPVALVGVIGLSAGITAKANDDRERSPQTSANLSRAAQLFRKYTRFPI